MTLHATTRCFSALLGLAFLLPAAAASSGALHAPPRGSTAPPIVLRDLDGAQVRTEQLAGRTLVLIFGDVGHEGARKASADVMETLAQPRFARDSVIPILVVAQDRAPGELKEQASQARFPALILHDPDRAAFGAYRILVVPTVVVVDGKGKVVHSMPGFLPRFRELLAESILVATGAESMEQFEQSLAVAGPLPTDKNRHRADRMVHLGDELARHGLTEMAEARYAEAVDQVPGHIEARLGLASLMVRAGRLEEAEAQYRRVLEDDETNVTARLGIAGVLLRQGTGDMDQAEATLRAVLDKDPLQPRAWYLRALIHEQRGEFAQAAAGYRKAAELLMER